MSSAIRRLPAIFRENDDAENEEDHVFADEAFPEHPCFTFFAKKTCRLSIAGNSARLSSIHLNEKIHMFDQKETRVIRRKDASRNCFDPFKKYRVPDLVLSNIFSNLKRKDLCSVLQVSKKFNTVGMTSLNWSVIDAYERPVSEYSLSSIMKTKVRVLRLAGARPDPTLLMPDIKLQECFFVPSRLELLDLSRANLTQRQLLIVLRPCRKLVCLSLEGNLLDDTVASCVAANKDLLQLDMSMTHGITRTGALNIFYNCKKLEQLNASWCGMTTEILHVVFENISSKVRRLNLSGADRENGLIDEHIQMMSSACPNLVDLDLSDNCDLGNETLFLIIENFVKMQVLSINRCFGMDPNMFPHLKKMPSLRYLNLHGCISKNNLQTFIEMCHRLKINRQFFNFTAKPVNTTAPVMQIWGNSLKEFMI